MKRTKSKTTRISKKNETPKKRLAKKAGAKRPAVKTKPISCKPVATKAKSRPKKKIQKKNQRANMVAFSVKTTRVRSGRQSGDLQGLSGLQGADSESVTELL